MNGKASTAKAILSSSHWQCESCDAPHSGMFDLAAAAPDHWVKDCIYEPNSALRLDDDFLSEDFCVLGGRDFFVRCVLEIPVVGINQRFGFSCWSTLSRQNFQNYVGHFDDGHYPDAGPWSSWLSNYFYLYVADEPTACWMKPRNDRLRPTLHVHDPHHPLAIAQKKGIKPDEVLAIYDFYGHRAAQ